MSAGPHPSSPASPPPRVVVPAQPRWHGRIAAHLIHRASVALAASLRWTWIDHGGLGRARQGPVIFAIWHNRLALSLPTYRRIIHDLPGRRMAAMVSASRDGGILAHTLGLFDVRPIRGSSSRRGARALIELTDAAREGCDLALTPDGPRGPRYRAREGVILAAQLTGLPIVPVSCTLGWKKTFRSWDRFQMPLPGSKCEIHVGAPLIVPRSADGREREALRIELEQRLMALTQDDATPVIRPPRESGG